MRAPGMPSATSTKFTWREISCGDALIRSEEGELLAGRFGEYGWVVGKIRTGANKGKFVLAAAAATDGSDKPYGILAFDVDATVDGDTACEVHIAGDFDEDALIYGPGTTKEATKLAFEGRPIFLKRVAGGTEIGGIVD